MSGFEYSALEATGRETRGVIEADTERQARSLLRERGHSLILSEAGPTVFASLVASGLVDELFVTVSPLLAGRDGRPRLGLVEGAELLPGAGAPAELLSVRRADAHLFLRYRLG